MSLDLFCVPALPLTLPGARVVGTRQWLPQLLGQSRRGIEESLVVSAEIFPDLGSLRKDNF